MSKRGLAFSALLGIVSLWIGLATLSFVPASAQSRFGEWVMVTWDKGEPGFSRRYPSFNACEAARFTVIEALLQGGSDKAAQRLSAFQSTFPNEALAQSFIRDAIRRAKAGQTLTEREEQALRLVQAASPDPSADALRAHQADLITHHTICEYYPTHTPRTRHD